MASASRAFEGLRRLGGASAVALSVATASPAAASQWDLPPPPRSLASSSALLGGQSALARTWASQGIIPDLSSAFASSSAIPAALTVVRFEGASRFLGPTADPTTAALTPDMPAIGASSAGGPDVFGSVALPIGNTPYDSMWRRASALDAGALADWTGNFADVRGGNALEILREVNFWVNHHVDFVEDNVDGSPAEIWQTAADSLRRGRGDCEDYALAKLALLAALGFDREDLFLVIARDLVARGHHAVLAVRIDGRFFILDNATDELIEGERMNDYRPIFSYSAGRRWIHGFSATQARPVQIAASSTSSPAP